MTSECSREEEVGSGGKSEKSNSDEWGANSYRSVVTVICWRAKYAISSSVLMIIPKPSNQANTSPVGCVALNTDILHASPRLSIPIVIHKFLSF